MHGHFNGALFIVLDVARYDLHLTKINGKPFLCPTVNINV